jgi:serine/threonine protein kinase
MGVVYKARQKTLKREVALKMMLAEFPSPVLAERFRIEAEAAANLHHPNIVALYETGQHQGQPFLSMALIDGISLDRYIAEGGFCFGPKQSGRKRDENIARIMAKVARAVDYAHRHAVLHRDLKPSNIIIDKECEPHLTDFGVAKVIGDVGNSLTGSGAIIGTPSYMAPEQAAGESKRVTTGADIYSLGAVLYEMLTGQPPFRAHTPVETLKQVVESEPAHPSSIRTGIDRDLATISLKCLEKEPQRRYATAAALAEDLERWLRNEPITARPVRSAERLWRWARRNPAVATLTGAVALLLIGLTVGSVAAVYRIKVLNDNVGSQNKHLRKAILDGLVEVYSDPDTEFYDISSEIRRALAGHSGRRRVVGPPLDLTNVLYVYKHPTNMLETFSPILDALEDKLSQRLDRTVAIHMRMSQVNDVAHKALESSDLAFGRSGPASYMYLRNRGRGVRLLAMQDHRNPLTLALFTRTDSEIARLLVSEPSLPLATLLKGRSLAMSHTNSTTGYHVPKHFLATNGMRASDLGRCILFEGQSKVFDAVKIGQADFGAGNLEFLKDYPDLQTIATVEVKDLGLCWIAGKGLNEAVEKHLRECLLELRDPAILAKLESKVSGFKIPSAEALERLQIIIDGAAAFDVER